MLDLLDQKVEEVFSNLEKCSRILDTGWDLGWFFRRKNDVEG
jgi:hypothetical protein